MQGGEKMILEQVVQALNLKEVTNCADFKREIKDGFTSDLLSVVMGEAEENMVWVTMQGHINVPAVASLLGLSCVIVTNDVRVENATIERANANKIAIFSTPLSSFKATGMLYELGIGKC
jgi:hypothetical protein